MQAGAAQLSWQAIQAIVGVELPSSVLRFDEIPFHLAEATAPRPEPDPEPGLDDDSDIEIVEEEESSEAEDERDIESPELRLAETDNNNASPDDEKVSPAATVACPSCDESFTSKTDLTEHHARRHPPDEPVPMSIENYLEVTLSTGTEASHACDSCDQIFSTERALSSHNCPKRSDEKKYPCHVCAEKFSSYWELRKHMNGHFPGMLDSKSSFCHLCQKDYTKTGFMNHLRKHTGERPFVCELCHKAFSQSSSLSIHMKFHLNVRKHACSLCEKKFVTKSELSRHMTVHTKQKSYYCGVCDKAFTRSDNMKKHEKTHG